MRMITSLSNAKVKMTRRLQQDRRFREREQLFVVEGTRWLSELVVHPPEWVFYTASWVEDIENATLLDGLVGQKLLVSDDVLVSMSDMATPPGVLAVTPMPQWVLPVEPTFLLVLDQINNPGNLGTMLRTAGAAGVEAVLLASGCVDPYNPKVVRGGMGAQLRLPMFMLDWDEIEVVVGQTAVTLATIHTQTPYTAIDWTNPSTLIIGSEANGASTRAKALAQPITIPMHSQTESLNAAMSAGIILFEAMRQKNSAGIPRHS